MLVIDGAGFTYSLCAMVAVGVILLAAMLLAGKKGKARKRGQLTGVTAGCLLVFVGILTLWFV